MLICFFMFVDPTTVFPLVDNVLLSCLLLTMQMQKMFKMHISGVRGYKTGHTDQKNIFQIFLIALFGPDLK